MNGTDLQIARVEIILAADRPQPEATEAEVRRVFEHLTVTKEATPTAKTLETGR